SPHRLLQDRLAILQREGGGERALHLGEGARADATVLGHGELLFGGAYLNLRLELAAEEERRVDRGTEACHRVVALLQHEELARDAGQRRGERNARQPCRLGLL